MNKRYLALLAFSAVASGLTGNCSAAPSTAFVPASASVAPDAAPRSNADEIQIMTNAPAENVTILGELKVQGDSTAVLGGKYFPGASLMFAREDVFVDFGDCILTNGINDIEWDYIKLCGTMRVVSCLVGVVWWGYRSWLGSLAYASG